MNPIDLLPFTNPYKGAEDTSRINCDVSREDFLLLRSCHPERGFMTTAVALLVKSIADECRRNKITYLDSRQLELFVLRRLGSADLGVTHPTHHTDDGGRTPGVHKKETGIKNIKPVGGGTKNAEEVNPRIKAKGSKGY